MVNECVKAGFTEIVLVTHESKAAIENHFDTSYELESTLEKRVKRQLLEEVRDICPQQVTVLSVRQGVVKGLGHAILCARSVIGDAPFAVVLPDVILDEYTADQSNENLADMKQRFDYTGSSQVMVEAVANEDVSKYGIVDCGEVSSLSGGEAAAMTRVVEKPKTEDAPSNLAVVGRYVLDKAIWPLLERTPLGVGDEIQLTDAIAMLMDNHEVEAFCMTGKSHDCGDKLGYMKANVEYAMRNSAFGDELQEHLKKLVEG